MALFRTGGGMSETTLWTNASPTSSFSEQDVTLSQSIANFDYIKISCKNWTTATDTLSVLMPVENFKNLCDSSHANRLAILAVYGSNPAWQFRTARYVDDTTIHINGASRSGSGTQSQNAIIPLNIYGVKL